MAEIHAREVLSQVSRLLASSRVNSAAGGRAGVNPRGGPAAPRARGVESGATTLGVGARGSSGAAADAGARGEMDGGLGEVGPLVYVAGSGASLDVEQAVSRALSGPPGARIVGSGLGVLPAAIGRLAVARGAPDAPVLRFRFRGPLEAWENALSRLGPDGGPATEVQRVAALLVGATVGRHRGKSEHAQVHRSHFLSSLAVYLGKATKQVEKVVGALAPSLVGYELASLRAHAHAGVEAGAIVVAFPPDDSARGRSRTVAGGAAAIDGDRFLAEAIEWERPPADSFTRDDVASWVISLAETGAPYVIGTRCEVSGLVPSACFSSVEGTPFWLYSNTTRATSYIRKDAPSAAFGYETATVADISRKSRIDITPADAKSLAFLKAQYLGRDLHPTSEAGYLAWIDGRLLGAFAYRRSQVDPVDALFLVTDFAVVADSRLAKLVTLLAMTRQSVDHAGRRFLIKPRRVTATLPTDRARPNLYQGVLENESKSDGAILYTGSVREATPQAAFEEWWRRHGRDLSTTARNGRSPDGRWTARGAVPRGPELGSNGSDAGAAGERARGAYRSRID